MEMLSIYEYCILLKILRKGGGEDKGRGGLKSCINLITYAANWLPLYNAAFHCHWIFLYSMKGLLICKYKLFWQSLWYSGDQSYI